MTEPVTPAPPPDEVALLRILTRFYRYLDAGDIPGLAAFMHPQSVWYRQGRELRCYDDIAEALGQRDPRLHIFHLLTNVTFEPQSGAHVAYSGYLTVLRSLADPAQAVRMQPRGAQSVHICKGEFRRAAGEWRISVMDAGPPRLLIDLPGD